MDQLNALQAGEVQLGQVGVPMIGAVLRGMDLVILGNYTGSAARLGSDATMALLESASALMNRLLARVASSSTHWPRRMLVS